MCVDYDDWYSVWDSWNSRQYVGPTPPDLDVPVVVVPEVISPIIAVYDCESTDSLYVPNSITYNRLWCNGFVSATLERPCTLTKADYLAKVAAVSDWHNDAARESFNTCACDGQGSTCQIAAYGSTRP